MILNFSGLFNDTSLKFYPKVFYLQKTNLKKRNLFSVGKNLPKVEHLEICQLKLSRQLPATKIIYVLKSPEIYLKSHLKYPRTQNLPETLTYQKKNHKKPRNGRGVVL